MLSHLEKNLRSVTLRDKQKSLPHLSELIGAVDLHLKGPDQEEMETVKQLEAKGVKRMLINSGASRQTLDWMRALFQSLWVS